jgi:hypothetical protein
MNSTIVGKLFNVISRLNVTNLFRKNKLIIVKSIQNQIKSLLFFNGYNIETTYFSFHFGPYLIGLVNSLRIQNTIFLAI